MTPSAPPPCASSRTPSKTNSLRSAKRSPPPPPPPPPPKKDPPKKKINGEGRGAHPRRGAASPGHHDQAAPRLHRAVHQRQPPRTGRRRSRRDRGHRGVPAQGPR